MIHLKYLILAELYINIYVDSVQPCFESNCVCSLKDKSALCSGLTFVPILPGFVKNLVLQLNNFGRVSRQLLFNISKNDLQSIAFEQNSIMHISGDAFEDLKTLNYLTISQESLLNVENVQNVLHSLKRSSLKKISLERNNWENLPLNMFNSNFLKNVVSISLSGNKLYNINTGSFANLSRLNNLNFESNGLETFNLDAILYARKLKLKRNDLVRLPSFCSSVAVNRSNVPNLIELDLTGNALSKISSSFFKCLPSLETLYLDSNRFIVLNDYTFIELPRLQRLFMQQNLELKEIGSFAFYSESLNSLYFGFNNFRFDFQDKKIRFDPANIFRYLPCLKYLDLSNNYLPSDNTTVTSMFWYLEGLTNLSLQAVGLRTLHSGFFSHLKSIRKLILTGNYIEYWSDGVFDGLSNLKYLNLQSNHIHLLNETSISSEVLNGLDIVDIGSNPFSCTCDLMWFRNWIRTTNVSLGNFPYQYHCTFPIELKDSLLIKYNPTKKSCTPWDPLFTILIVMSAFGFLVLISVVTVYKCHANIRNYFYLLRLQRLRKQGYLRLDNNEDFEFHAFVVYCEADSDWVHKVFVKRMEDKGIKLCIHHREFDCGTPITENIDKYMNKSWKIVVVMSNAFASSEWCQWEVDYVQERRRRQGRDACTLIMLKTIDSDHMTSSIRTLLLTTPYLRYRKGIGEELFWGAVVDSLQKPLSVPPMAI